VLCLAGENAKPLVLTANLLKVLPPMFEGQIAKAKVKEAWRDWQDLKGR